MNGPLNDVCCASIPAEALPLLAPLRTSTMLRIRQVAGRVWLHWPAGDEEILRRVLPIRGAEVFARRDGQWFRPGQHLPASDVQDDTGAQTLLHLLAPAPIKPVSRTDEPAQPITLRLVRDGQPRNTSALECGAAELLQWADMATTHALASVEIATSREHALMLGAHLPAIGGAVRFWGRTVLLPLGFRCEPNLPESALRDALDLSAEELIFLREDRAEIVNRAVFRPATRAALRRAWAEVSP
jgi:hypothetical protein